MNLSYCSAPTAKLIGATYRPGHRPGSPRARLTALSGRLISTRTQGGSKDALRHRARRHVPGLRATRPRKIRPDWDLSTPGLPEGAPAAPRARRVLSEGRRRLHPAGHHRDRRASLAPGVPRVGRRPVDLSSWPRASARIRGSSPCSSLSLRETLVWAARGVGRERPLALPRVEQVVPSETEPRPEQLTMAFIAESRPSWSAIPRTRATRLRLDPVRLALGAPSAQRRERGSASRATRSVADLGEGRRAMLGAAIRNPVRRLT
jgi:hypothetical protein